MLTHTVFISPPDCRCNEKASDHAQQLETEAAALASAPVPRRDEAYRNYEQLRRNQNSIIDATNALGSSRLSRPMLPTDCGYSRIWQ